MSSTVHSDVDREKENDKNLRLTLNKISVNAQPGPHDHTLTCNRNLKFRSDIYAHYSRTHYKKELLNILGENESCPECGMGKKNIDDLIVHIGRVHGYVEQFLPKSFQIPLIS